MRAAGAEGRRVRIRGGGTKSSWGRPAEPPEVDVSTERLDRVVEHNEGDLTAVFEAGLPLARAQEALAEAGQMVALDPPFGRPAKVIGPPSAAWSPRATPVRCATATERHAT